MIVGSNKIDLGLPFWADYRSILCALEGVGFPQCSTLTGLLPSAAINQRGLPIQFVSAGDLPGVEYEKHIYRTGEVSTREENWHDLFNALVWIRFPRLKAAMNARHNHESGHEMVGRRGKLRDGLTLLDESGVIVSGSDPQVLQALANKDWNTAFVTRRSCWENSIRVTVCGHAILEKLITPYKSVTAHAVLLQTPRMMSNSELDDWLGTAVLAGKILNSPGCLSPLPLMGVPGWWAGGAQDGRFYDDLEVFRPDSGRRAPAPVHKISNH
jgi:hypothetical protein